MAAFGPILTPTHRAMPRFVVLRHETPAGSARPLHWDFMVEAGATLRTWALAEEPIVGREIAAEPLADHRLAYLDYEGSISGDRGSVTRFDRGECTIVESTPEQVRLEARGSRIAGEVLITARNEKGATFRWLSPDL